MKRAIFWIAVASLIASGSSAETEGGCRPDFIAAREYSNPTGALALAAGDLNGDGRPDLVVTTIQYSEGISVRLALADGTFGPPINKTTNDYTYASALGAFNSGGVLDVALATQAGIDFFAGNGDGTFQDPVETPGTFLNVLEAADLNGDSTLDLVGVPYFGGDLVALLGNGDGTFQAPVETELETSPAYIALGDIDGDDNADLVATGGFNTVGVYQGLGDGHFAPPTDVIVGLAASNVQLTDVSGDGDLDMLLVSNGYVGVLLGNGDGTFQTSLKYYAGPNPIDIIPGDFDGNATTDLAVLNPAAGTAWILVGTGGGAFTLGPIYFAGSGATTGVAADFGNEGALDLAVASNSSTRISVLSGKGDGTLVGVRYSPLSNYPGGFARGDFDEDGRLDLVAGDDNSARVFLGSGDGAFTPGADYAFPTQVVSIAVGHFDADNHADLALSLANLPQVNVLLGNGDGTFRDGPILAISFPSNFFPELRIADFSGDGISDVAVASQSNGPPGGGISVFLGLADGTFGPETPNALANYPAAMAAADFDGDGRADLSVLTTNYPDHFLEVLLSVGDGTLTPEASYALLSYSDSIVAGAFHNGGPVDLVVGTSNEANLRLFTGQGDGTFAGPTVLGVGSATYELETADFDADGNLDLVAASSGDVGTTLLGLGNGAFQSPRAHAVGQGPFTVVTGDFDGNGLTDAVFEVYSFNISASTALLNGGLGALVSDVGVLVGSAAELTVTASGFGSLTYQWRKDGVPLADGGPISGVTTATLTIDPVAFTDASSYDVLVTDDCGTLPSDAGTLSVEFADVALSSPFHDDIIAIATAGITGGCGGANYCPTSPVRRDQMAVFLLKAEHGSAYTPPACTGVFADVPCPSAFADWVEQLAAEGITGGCGGGNYCPDSSVTRAQMAVFLLKTSDGSGYTPPPATGIFGDVPVGSFAADFIEELYDRGITGGCSASPLLYCPGNPVLRQQMATFLARTFLP